MAKAGVKSFDNNAALCQFDEMNDLARLSTADEILLREILAIPTRTGQEDAMVRWLEAYCSDKGWKYERDKANNIYVEKSARNIDWFPCVSAHTDSVHPIQEVSILKNNGRLTAHHPDTGSQVGLGGDDKAGIFICIKMLNEFPAIKATFFAGEEHFCIGSHQLLPAFFDNVGYHIAFDSPCEDIVTWICNGVQLFSFKSEFFEKIYPILKAHDAIKFQIHPYTDSYAVKKRFNFACINLPAAYFNMHSRQEYVSIPGIVNCISLGKSIIDKLGPAFYATEYDAAIPHGIHVTGLQMHDYGES